MKVPVFTISGTQRTLVTMLDDPEDIQGDTETYLRGINRLDIKADVYANLGGHDYKVFLDPKEEA
ncbi:hypothetical protein [Lacticaseibacillus sp. GG6-2]